MHFGRSNAGGKYRVNSRTLKSIDKQRDLSVQVHRSLKVKMQVEKVVKKAYGMLSFIGRGIKFKNWQGSFIERYLGRTWNIVFNSGRHTTRNM